MGQNIDYSIVDANVAAMKDIADNIHACQMAMSYYSYGTINIQGEYANSFENTKIRIQSIAGQIEKFISGYADVIDCVAKNFDTFDKEMKQQVDNPNWVEA